VEGWKGGKGGEAGADHPNNRLKSEHCWTTDTFDGGACQPIRLNWLRLVAANRPTPSSEATDIGGGRLSENRSEVRCGYLLKRYSWVEPTVVPESAPKLYERLYKPCSLHPVFLIFPNLTTIPPRSLTVASLHQILGEGFQSLL